MSKPEPDAMTLLLHSARAGDASAGAALLALAYEELGKLARAHFVSQRDRKSKQPPDRFGRPRPRRMLADRVASCCSTVPLGGPIEPGSTASWS